MFNFRGVIDGQSYLVAVIIRFCCFVLANASFPFLVYAYAWSTNCSYACGAIGLMASIFGKPVIVVVFAFSLLGISIRRLRTLGLSGWLGLALPALVLWDTAQLIVMGSPWAGLVLGIVSLSLPFGLFGAMLLSLLMAAIPDEAIQQNATRLWSRLSVAFVFALIAYLIANMTTGRLFAFQDLEKHLLNTAPTVGLYFFVLAFAYLAWAWRSRVGLVVTVGFVFLFVHWGYSSWTGSEARQAELIEIAAIETTPLPMTPDSVLLVGSIALDVEDWPSEITTRWRHVRHGTGTMTSRRATSSWTDWEYTGETLPEYHLILKTGDESAFATQVGSWLYRGPYELRSVSPSQNDLIAVWYKSGFVIYSSPPLLTKNGWVWHPSVLMDSLSANEFVSQVFAESSE